MEYSIAMKTLFLQLNMLRFSGGTINPASNPFFMERFGINAIFNSGAIKLNGKYVLIARVEGNSRKSFFAIAESDNGIDNFRFRIFRSFWRKPKIRM